ncbi:MAG: DUF3467 domain-containing protein [Acidobacteriia bacterium]|nr:DUF3467 domain-containing protein [Terriglobia bacterium]
MSEEKSPARPPLEFVRLENFKSTYSNNVQFEVTSTDLKIIFGQFDQHTKKAIVEQQAAVTLSWMQVKLLSYSLRVNLAFYEILNGKINITKDLLPPLPPPLPSELENNPQAQAGLEAVLKVREEFLSSLQS